MAKTTKTREKTTVKFRDSEADYRQLVTDIKARRYAPVYLLMGEEPYFIDRLCELLATSILNEAERSFSQIMLYGHDTDGGTVASYCRQVPMMGEYQVVIVREAQALDKLETLALYTASPMPSTILVICHKGRNADKRQQLYKTCAANGVVFESVAPREYEIGAWLGDFVRSKGLEIDEHSVGLLVNHLGTDISRIDNELSKLVVSLPENVKRITPDEIELYIGISKEFNNFELCNAVVTRNVERALRIADHLSRNPKEYPLLLTVMALFGSFREIFILNYLQWKARHDGTAMPSDNDLSIAIYKRPGNLFPLRELKQNAARWDNRKVFAILGLLREYDAKSKGMDTGGANEGELLRELLLKMFML